MVATGAQRRQGEPMRPARCLGSDDVGYGDPVTRLDRAPAWKPEDAISACLVAMEAAGRSAASCLADPTLTDDPATSESAIVAARLLGTFADVATLEVSAQRIELVTALMWATLIAAESCAEMNRGFGLDACATTADACTAAAEELRRLLASTPPSGRSASVRGRFGTRLPGEIPMKPVGNEHEMLGTEGADDPAGVWSGSRAGTDPT